MSARVPDLRIVQSPREVMSPSLRPEDAALVPAVSRALWAWDLLGLELGDVALVTGEDAQADLVALVASWYGALPVVRLSLDARPLPRGIDGVVLDDPQRTIADLAARFSRRPGVAVVDLSGRSGVIEVLLASLPTFARLLLAGSACEPLTIDFYNNVHRKGLDLRSGVFHPALEHTNDPAAERRLARATLLLQRSERAEACRAAIGALSEPAEPRPL
jgi:hypothetical protein